MKAVILTAGKGERLQPLTDHKPKSLLPIANKPLIDYQLDILRKEGIDEVAIVVGYLEKEIRRHLDGVKFYRDDKMEGTASALYAAKNFIDDNFLLLYGDLFFDFSLQGLISNRNSMGICKVKDVSRYGEVIVDRGYMKDIKEKGGHGWGYINAGIYHLEPDVLDCIERVEKSERGEYELTNSLKGLYRLKVIPLEGYWNDVGYPWEYMDANMYMLNRIGFSMGENVEIWNSAIIRKPVIIGEGCEIKNCVLESSVIGAGCVAGEFSVVKRSVMMDNSKASHLNYVADSVIAERCNLGAGTKIANLRFDDKSVRMTIREKRLDSERRKLGAFLGYGVKTGINVSIYPGVKISSGKWIEAECLVKRDL